MANEILTIGNTLDLAESLDKDAEFFDVEGIPVSIGETSANLYCAAWDVFPPRKFSSESARRNGAPVSREVFAKLLILQDWQKQHQKSHKKQNEPSKFKNRLLFFLAFLGGLIVFGLVSSGFSLLGNFIDVPININFGEEVIMTVGSGKMSYEEESSGMMTSYGVFSMLIAVMIGIRSGISIFKLRFDGGYSRVDNLEFVAWLLGACLAAAFGALFYHLFNNLSGWMFSTLHILLEALAFWCIWKIINKWIHHG